MVKASEAMSARARARQAKAALDAERAEQDRMIVDTTTEYYEAEEALEAAQVAVRDAELTRQRAIWGLSELGQTDEQIAVLCGLTTKEVREVRRRVAAEKKQREDAMLDDAGATSEESDTPPPVADATETAA